MTTSLFEGTKCRTCGQVGHCTLADDNGQCFCNTRCYAAYCEDIHEYLDVANNSRHDFERIEKDRKDQAYERRDSPWLDFASTLARLGAPGPDLWRRR